MAYKKEINIDNFLISIDTMLQSKYILIDRRISDILLSIADSKDVYNLIAECMINFDFKQEWKNATKTNVMKLPASVEKRISFIFCLLNNIDDKNLDVTNVLEKFFSYDSNYSPYELFCLSIIVEFKKLVMRKLGIENADASQNNTQTIEQDYDANIDEFVVLSKHLREFASFVLNQKKLKHCMFSKNDLIAVVSTFVQVVENKQVDYFYSYQVTISSAIEKNKELKSKFAETNKLIDSIIRGDS